MNRIKNVPQEVRKWFETEFQDTFEKKFTFNFYTYDDRDGVKIYGCEVYENGKYIHNATQAPLAWYRGNS